MPTHTLYIDDSGTREYLPDPSGYDVSVTRHFVFGGVLISTPEALRLSTAISALKTRSFGQAKVEVKSNWLRIPHERKSRYLAPYGLTDDQLEEFVDEYYSLVGAAELMLIAAVVDKVHMQESYPSPWYPPAVAYELMLQRAENEMRPANEFSVIIDAMTGKTPKHREYQLNLLRQHLGLLQNGSHLLDGYTFNCLRGKPKFVDSADSHLVQVADLAAYNVFRQFREYGDQWEDATLKKLPTYGYFERISDKFRASPDGRVQGYGIVKFPVKNKVRWMKE